MKFRVTYTETVQAFEWGEKYGVGILIDMHAAPGSQNGDDHSAPPDNHVQNWDKYTANQVNISTCTFLCRHMICRHDVDIIYIAFVVSRENKKSRNLGINCRW